MLHHNTNDRWDSPPESPESPCISDGTLAHQDRCLEDLYEAYRAKFSKGKLTREDLLNKFRGDYKEEWLYADGGDYIEELISNLVGDATSDFLRKKGWKYVWAPASETPNMIYTTNDDLICGFVQSEELDKWLLALSYWEDYL